MYQLWFREHSADLFGPAAPWALIANNLPNEHDAHFAIWCRTDKRWYEVESTFAVTYGGRLPEGAIAEHVSPKPVEPAVFVPVEVAA
jgi:hypothetical protein